MNAPELLASLEAGKVPALTVFFGEEGWFGEEAVRVVRRQFLAENDEGYLSYEAPRRQGDAEGMELCRAVEEGRTVPMFGGRQLVVWRGRSVTAEDVAALADLAGASPAFVRFVVLVGSLPQAAAKKLEKAGAGVGQSRKLFETAWPGNPEHDTPLNRWTVERAGRRTLSLDLRTAHLLTGGVGNDLAAIDATLEHLLLLSGRDAVVREEDLASVLGGGREFDAFAFGDAIYRRDTAKAFLVSGNAFREGISDQSGRRSRDPGYVAGRLIWSAGFQLERVYDAARLLGEGMPPGEVARTLGRGRASPVVKRAVGMARDFTVKELREHFVRLGRAEAATRTPVPPDAIIAELIPHLTGAADG